MGRGQPAGARHHQVDPGGSQDCAEAQKQADEVLEESPDYRLEEVDFFMQEFGTWSWQLDKLLVTGAAASFTGQAA